MLLRMTAIGNVEPITLGEISKDTGLSVDMCREFFAEHFGSYEDYVQACKTKPSKVLDVLDKLNS